MILYGIPNCDTVKKARKFLENENLDYQFNDFRKDGLKLTTIQSWLEQQPIDVIVNKRSTSWKQLTDQQKTKLMDGEQLQLLIEMPTLIKRPVLEVDEKVLFGFNKTEYEKLI